ncbi:unnamed protein product [Symbiodinium necroappetens]|uniref:Sulfotransferase domain-containing protein n=1 Tax=Symbiodinium necroappetens TaxID=1628268 RepID=A0A813CBA1_9DINO|nr:unnamed protein product [Symbiodinium necroappetens]
MRVERCTPAACFFLLLASGVFLGTWKNARTLPALREFTSSVPGPAPAPAVDALASPQTMQAVDISPTVPPTQSEFDFTHVQDLLAGIVGSQGPAPTQTQMEETWRPPSPASVAAVTATTTAPTPVTAPAPPLGTEPLRKTLKFIHITKTGGTAIEQWGKEHGHRWGMYHKEYKVPGRYPPAPWHHFFPELDAELRHRYDWFMVVRDPVDRVISEYYCPWAGSPSVKTDTVQDFNRFILRGLRDKQMWATYHWALMSSYLDSTSVQHVLKNENLESDFGKLLRIYGIPFDRLYRTNKARVGGHKFGREHLWQETILQICETYADDFEAFNYSMPSLCSPAR